MELLSYIAYAGVVIWVLIPIRQFRTRLFLFFLILALLDLIAFVLVIILKTNFEIIYLIGTSFLLYPLLSEHKIVYKLTLLSILISAAFIIFFYTSISPIFFQMIIHLVIFIFFLRVLVLFYGISRRILYFHLVLLTYEFSLLLKFYIYWNDVDFGFIYFTLTTLVQIVIGLFFLFFNEKNSPMIKV